MILSWSRIRNRTGSDRIAESVHDSTRRKQSCCSDRIQYTHTPLDAASYSTHQHLFSRHSLPHFTLLMILSSSSSSFTMILIKLDLHPLLFSPSYKKLIFEPWPARHDTAPSCNFMYLMTCQSFSYAFPLPDDGAKCTYGRSRSLFISTSRDNDFYT